MMEGIFRNATRLGVIAATAGFINEFCLFDVEPGFKAAIFDQLRGLQYDIRGEGTHFKIPILQRPIIVDVRSRPRVIHSATGTKDLQTVNIALRVLSRPQDAELAKIINQLGPDFDERVLPSIGNEILKAVVARYNAEELLSKRESVSVEIRKQLTERANNFNIILDDVSITHLTFGKEFTKAIESKQVAQQEAERQQWFVKLSEQERRAAVTRAEGEAEAARLISEAIQASGNGIIRVRQIDAARDIAHRLSTGHHVTYLPPTGSSMLLNLHDDDDKKK